VLVRDDYVTNSNNSPWLSNPGAPLTGYPRVMGDIDTERSLRTREGLVAVERRLAGDDGLPGRGFSLATMRDVLFSDHSRLAELAAGDTAAMCAGFPDGLAPSPSGPVDVSGACEALASWDHTFSLDQPGAVLFARFAASLSQSVGDPWVVDFDPADPVGTPNTLDTSAAGVQEAFGAAVAELQAAGVALDATLRDVQGVTRGDEVIPIHGAAENTGTLNLIDGVTDPATGQVEVTGGSSFIQVVELTGRRPPLVTTLLTNSQSSDPTSPYHDDQTRLFSDGEWVRGRYTERQILSSPELRVELLIEKQRR
jgi:acyl-homoserine-lactone acylase